MSDIPFKYGDKVTDKCANIPMSILSISEDGQTMRCRWKERVKFYDADFKTSDLKLYEPEADSKK
jgi:uncharacterized protein YodC (DUF2158 family)